AQRISPYNEMYVWDRDSFGSISFNGEETGFSHLGHIIENDVIQQSLWQHAERARDVTLIAPAALKQVAWGENEAFITLEDGSMLTARLVVGADGAHSWLRQHADIPLTFWDYGHHALVANIRTQRPHDSVARQVFHGDGMLAFLPLCDPHLCSIVWSLPPERAQTMLEAPAETFNSQLAAEFDMRLGLCELESERQSFPLTARYARSFAAHRLVLMGDAAHTIHPLAGQGVNLGFMDVAELIAELKRLQSQGKDIGQYLYLRRYERRRKHSAAVMLASMQGFRDLFAGSHPAKKLLRDVGLKLADTLPGIKPTLVRQAMGFHDMPEWLEEQR
ncbi:FAD-dependent 2-octaprenylphenol hydroxylase, partial [Lonsdalea britannica]|uniref:FAD-dependent 2-octaprenylphenol hydroxylase n=1 Tax=Lonsdalea britannica TaxID=1082704 RepID=UPI0026EC628C